MTKPALNQRPSLSVFAFGDGALHHRLRRAFRHRTLSQKTRSHFEQKNSDRPPPISSKSDRPSYPKYQRVIAFHPKHQRSIAFYPKHQVRSLRAVRWALPSGLLAMLILQDWRS
ncbi:hypothetical protein [Cylindrospermum stagnale]|uniref:hypothetical protein n=1 Tax=Cylindrospermum stagnale TaxID=142864 RepID=UPI0012F6F31A|nr:hypothetical protein [Cylindrospermum stagnale]